MKISSKLLSGATAVLLAIAGLSQASALPLFAGKPVDAGKPTSSPTQTSGSSSNSNAGSNGNSAAGSNAASKPSNTPGNLSVFPNAPATSSSNAGQDAANGNASSNSNAGGNSSNSNSNGNANANGNSNSGGNGAVSSNSSGSSPSSNSNSNNGSNAVVNPNKPTETGKPAGSAKPEVVLNLVKTSQPSLDATDAGPKANYLVRFNESAVVANEVSSLKAAKIDVGRTFAHVFKGLVAKMTVKQVAALAKRSSVAAIELDATAQIQTSEPAASWGIDRIDQSTLPLSLTYDYTNTGAGVIAYVVDTGIYDANVAFGGRVGAGFTAVLDGNGTVDCNGHGTHVAGTIGSTTYGVAKGVKLVPVRVLDCAGSGSYSNVVAGLDWIAQNYVSGTSAVVNLSLGGPVSSTVDTAINNLINRGVTVVVAAGNSAADACNSSPASVPNAITVAASDRNDQFAIFSNFGSCVDLVAPGVNITSTWIGSTNATNTISGTSMASPHVAGVVALMLSTGYRLPTQVAQELLAATSVGAVGAVPTGTSNRLLFSSSTGWTSVSAPTATAPSVPTSVVATAGSRSAIVRWVLPSSDGGSALLSQTVKVWSGATLVGTVSAAANATSLTVKGLRGRTQYQFSVVASNAVGTSIDSAKSAVITVLK
jgi:subtilisin family serine protease